ncbi:hypothetical protein AB0I59_38410 [Microtetraspora glauca]|uniref:Uncharacterized protein n=1 Tax=Microtetraspora glauca TaxID=1996 RepID=A0ABV3GT72_MICGL
MPHGSGFDPYADSADADTCTFSLFVTRSITITLRPTHRVSAAAATFNGGLAEPACTLAPRRARLSALVPTAPIDWRTPNCLHTAAKSAELYCAP